MNTAPTRILLLNGFLVASACPLLLGGTAAPATAGPAASPEVRVNTTTADAQLEPDIAMDADGDHVVVWTSGGSQDGSDYGVFAQRFNAAGVAQGAETLVNTTTTFSQGSASVAMDADGDYVVTWNSFGQDGSGYGIYSQRYDAAGTPQGAETLVNQFTNGDQTDSSVAMDARGNFAVTWTTTDRAGLGVYLQRFNASGIAQGSLTQVNSFADDNQYQASTAMDADGDFVVVWTSDGQDGGGSGVYAQRYNAAGIPQGSETRVNTTTTLSQRSPSVAMEADGDYVVTWSSDSSQIGNPNDIYSQSFSATGATRGPETKVNTTTSNSQIDPTVATDAEGGHVIAWTSLGQDGDAYGVFAQRYKADDTPQGAETSINSTTVLDQYNVSVASDADGDFVASWTGTGQDGSGPGIYARRFRGPAAVDLRLAQSDNADPIAVDGRIVYRLRVTNLNDDADVTGVEAIDRAIGAADGVYVISAVPDGAALLSTSGAGWSCGPATTTVKCRLATTIAPGEGAPGLLLTYSAPDEAGPALHHARVYQRHLDPAPTNDSEVERTSVMCAIEFAHPNYSKSEFSPATATVTRHGTNCGTSIVQYDSTAGTATLGADFTDVAGTLTWTDADTAKTFSVPLIDDTLDENTERLKLTLGNATGALLGTSLITVYIGDNDAPPRINFTTATTAASETTGLVELTVRLSAASGRDVTVDLARSGTATHGSDYFTETRLTIPAGQRTAAFDVEITNDAAAEGAETATLTLTNPNGATPGSVARHHLTISASD